MLWLRGCLLDVSCRKSKKRTWEDLGCTRKAIAFILNSTWKIVTPQAHFLIRSWNSDWTIKHFIFIFQLFFFPRPAWASSAVAAAAAMRATAAATWSTAAAATCTPAPCGSTSLRPKPNSPIRPDWSWFVWPREIQRQRWEYYIQSDRIRVGVNTRNTDLKKLDKLKKCTSIWSFFWRRNTSCWAFLSRLNGTRASSQLTTTFTDSESSLRMERSSFHPSGRREV